MRITNERCLFLVEHLNLAEAAQVEDAKWERFQIEHLLDDGLFRCETKARQIAWSFTVAAEAVANAVLAGESTIFVSINLEEAKEKARYARRVYANLEIGGLPKVTTDNVLGLEFDNDARILSLPSRPPRGKAKTNIVLDEFAHVMHDREIYTAALPIISRGGKIRIGSSPMGAVGTFWEISRQELRQYPGYTRVVTPWWKVASFCSTKPIDAEGMETADRVGQFGNERIQVVFANMPLDDFRQEYECAYIDEAVSFFPWELIRKNQDDTLLHFTVKDPDDIDLVVREMKEHLAAGDIETTLAGGVDVGRKRHLTEIILVGVGDKKPVRLMVSLDRVEFDVQERVIRHILQILPVTSLLIDQNGLGMHLAENLAKDTCAQGVDFTNVSKALWVTELKIQMERGAIPLPLDRDLAYEIHSIKKVITVAKNNVYDAVANEKHHADKLWALALASWAAREAGNRPEWGKGAGWQRR